MSCYLSCIKFKILTQLFTDSSLNDDRYLEFTDCILYSQNMYLIFKYLKISVLTNPFRV